MNLIEELTPYNESLTNYIKRGIVPSNEHTNNMLDIYDRFFKNLPEANAPYPAKRCCGHTGDALKMLYNWRAIKEREVSVDFKAVISKEDKIKHLKAQLTEKGIKFHHKAGVKKLSELLNG